jgi:ATP-dependent exoDNAse (exonuclease V) alpha subunit
VKKSKNSSERSLDQQQAIIDFSKWWHSTNERIFALDGAAGTGKTSTAQKMAEAIGCNVLYAAPTGQAASRMRLKGCVGAGTIHGLLYFPNILSVKTSDDAKVRQKDQLEWIERRTAPLSRGKQRADIAPLVATELLVVDESSMVSDRLWNSILAYPNVRVLALGDSAQLPPVKGMANTLLGVNGAKLETIHRQGLGSGLLTAATDVREGRALDWFYDASYRTVGNLSHLTCKEFETFDQIIAHSNAQKVKINEMVRQIKGFDADKLYAGERIIRLRNDHAKNVMNGSQWVVTKATTAKWLELQSVDDASVVVTYRRGSAPGPIKAELFEFAYCTTVHRAQGSEWPSVLIVGDAYVNIKSSSCAHPDYARRWWYTGITRANNRAVGVLALPGNFHPCMFGTKKSAAELRQRMPA